MRGIVREPQSGQFTDIACLFYKILRLRAKLEDFLLHEMRGTLVNQQRTVT